MNDQFKKGPVNFFTWGIIFLAGTTLFTFLITPQYFSEIFTAYLLSFLFVGANFLGIKNFENKSNTSFYRRFFISIALRFVLVIAALVFILKTINFHQIFFTVSFIISYILHSLIEVISINRILQTDN